LQLHMQGTLACRPDADSCGLISVPSRKRNALLRSPESRDPNRPLPPRMLLSVVN
jgi:hypothetical protein